MGQGAVGEHAGPTHLTSRRQPFAERATRLGEERVPVRTGKLEGFLTPGDDLVAKPEQHVVVQAPGRGAGRAPRAPFGSTARVALRDGLEERNHAWLAHGLQDPGYCEVSGPRDPVASPRLCEDVLCLWPANRFPRSDPAVTPSSTAEVREFGLLNRRPVFYAGLLGVILLALAASVAGLLMLHDTWWALLLAPVFAVVSTQIGFFGHDAAHRQISRRERASRMLGLFSANLLNGLSYGWWLDKHNAHHAHPNDLDSDPDVRAGAVVFDKRTDRGSPRHRGLDHPASGVAVRPDAHPRGAEPAPVPVCWPSCAPVCGTAGSRRCCSPPMPRRTCPCSWSR